jgi:hypothetical protein
MPNRIFWFFGARIGLLPLLALDLMRRALRRALVTGPRWKRRLAVAGIGALGWVGLLKVQSCFVTCYATVE